MGLQRGDEKFKNYANKRQVRIKKVMILKFEEFAVWRGIKTVFLA